MDVDRCGRGGVMGSGRFKRQRGKVRCDEMKRSEYWYVKIKLVCVCIYSTR